jgi:hypothetical protein
VDDTVILWKAYRIRTPRPDSGSAPQHPCMVLLAEAVGEAAGAGTATEEEGMVKAEATLEEGGDSSVPPQNQK